ncbi:MAG: hypothetical protein GF370_03275 [Candidatus Nealsonbacteria bacterium]|nr:hypothetical protein [Candidatus Nealsonbacteria bacterium]
MKITLSEQELEKIKKAEGEIRGMSFLIIKDFILRKRGEQGLEKIKEAMVEVGYPLRFDKISSTKFYPIGSLIAVFLVIQKLFDFEDKDFEEFGRFRAKSSPFIRIYMKYFVSMDKIVREAADMWKKSTTVGSVKIVEYDKEKKRLRAQIRDYETTQKQCIFFKGLLSGLFSNLTGKDPVCKETKCTYRGDDCHEFLVTW